jgi:hypothetical protein
VIGRLAEQFISPDARLLDIMDREGVLEGAQNPDAADEAAAAAAEQPRPKPLRIPGQASLCRITDEDQRAEVIDLLEASHDKPGCAYFLSGTNPIAMSWLRSGCSSAKYFQVSAVVFRDNLAMRLLMSPITGSWPIQQGYGFECRRCGKSSADPLAVDIDPRFHPLHCGQNAQGRLTRRHDDIRDLLILMLQQVYPAGTPVTPEPLLGFGPNGQRAGRQQKRADVLLEVDGKKTFIDVVVGDPTCQTYVVGSAFDQGHTASKVESAKVTEYLGLVREATGGTGVFVPFGLEPTGFLGGGARQFLEDVVQGHDEGGEETARRLSKVRAFKRRLAIILANHASQMVHKVRTCSRSLQLQGGDVALDA